MGGAKSACPRTPFAQIGGELRELKSAWIVEEWDVYESEANQPELERGGMLEPCREKACTNFRDATFQPQIEGMLEPQRERASLYQREMVLQYVEWHRGKACLHHNGTLRSHRVETCWSPIESILDSRQGDEVTHHNIQDNPTERGGDQKVTQQQMNEYRSAGESVSTPLAS